MSNERLGLVLGNGAAPAVLSGWTEAGALAHLEGSAAVRLRKSMPDAAELPDLQLANIQRGRVLLNVQVLKSLRAARLQSQDEMATACVEGRFRVSIASIKRAETGKPVMFRVARELARYFDVPVQLILLPSLGEYRPPQVDGV